jgi:hypothetical protein
MCLPFFTQREERSKLCSLECPFILPNMCANDVGKHGVELQLAVVVRQAFLALPMELLSLSDLRLAIVFLVGQKKTASNIAGLSCSTRYPALPNVGYDPSESLLRFAKHS